MYDLKERKTSSSADQFPTLKEVEEADHIAICRWYRFQNIPKTEAEKVILDLIIKRFKEGGGVNSDISRLIGWR